jgi:[ribosomal protein S5]-alanine N-acetyltransferase
MADAAAIAKYAHNRKIALNLRDAFPYPFTLQDAEAFISRALEAVPAILFAIATPSEAIGGIGLMPGEDVHRHTAEIGYWLAEPYWGRGIMTRAVKQMTTYALRELKLMRIFAEPYATNPASARVLEKAGCVREGTLRANVVKDGIILDQYIYSYVANAHRHPEFF